jgi:formylglycine-generating enzyme required for sulfatase activity
VDGSAWLEGGGGRVVRGGSWSNDARDCRAAFRDWGDLDDRSDGVGFRCARVQV